MGRLRLLSASALLLCCCLARPAAGLRSNEAQRELDGERPMESLVQSSAIVEMDRGHFGERSLQNLRTLPPMRGRQGGREAAEPELVLHDPHEVLDMARDPLESVGLAPDVVGVVGAYLIDEATEEAARESLIGTWEDRDADWNADPDYWTFRFAGDAGNKVRLNISTRVLNTRSSTDTLTLNPSYDERGFSGFTGSGHASWRTEGAARPKAKYTFSVDRTHGLRGLVSWRGEGDGLYSRDLRGRRVTR